VNLLAKMQQQGFSTTLATLATLTQRFLADSHYPFLFGKFSFRLRKLDMPYAGRQIFVHPIL